MTPDHVPVLLSEVIDGLALRPGMVVVDGTLGLGGHASVIAEHLGSTGMLIGFDRDQTNLTVAEQNLSQTPPKKLLIHDSFDNLASHLVAHHIPGVDGVLLDLGLSSPHVDQGERGFSFSKEGPLDMRFDQSQDTPTAADLVNTLPVASLAKIFWEYGEEKHSRQIAQAIVQHRQQSSFVTTTDLADVIAVLIPFRPGFHPATRVFQALRIAVNQELQVLEHGLAQVLNALHSHGRIAVIAYHSLEDRIVKDFFKKWTRTCVCPPESLQCICGGHSQKLKIITKKPVVPSDKEVRSNPRSRSAKLRIAEKL